MKVAITGKGGSGKTMAAGALIRHLAADAGRLAAATGAKTARVPEDPAVAVGELADVLPGAPV